MMRQLIVCGCIAAGGLASSLSTKEAHAEFDRLINASAPPKDAFSKWLIAQMWSVNSLTREKMAALTSGKPVMFSPAPTPESPGPVIVGATVLSALPPEIAHQEWPVHVGAGALMTITAYTLPLPRVSSGNILNLVGLKPKRRTDLSV